MKQKTNILKTIWEEFLNRWGYWAVCLIFIVLLVNVIIGAYFLLTFKTSRHVVYDISQCIHHFPDANKQYKLYLAYDSLCYAPYQHSLAVVESLNQELDSLIKEDEVLKANTKVLKDSLKRRVDNALKKRDEYYALLKPYYEGKKVRMKVKKIWYNSKVYPWTYDAYTHFRLNIRTKSSVGLMGGTSRTNVNMTADGFAEYLGDQKSSYINVICDNNFFYRVSIKDHQEWLLLKVGDYIECTYVPLKQPRIEDIVRAQWTESICPEQFSFDPLMTAVLGKSAEGIYYEKRFNPVFIR